MQHVLVQLKLKDYAEWKPMFDEMAGFRQTSGVKGERLFQQADNPQQVTILFEWDTLDRARQYFQSDRLREAMQRGGVVGPPNVQYLNEVKK